MAAGVSVLRATATRAGAPPVWREREGWLARHSTARVLLYQHFTADHKNSFSIAFTLLVVPVCSCSAATCGHERGNTARVTLPPLVCISPCFTFSKYFVQNKFILFLRSLHIISII